MRHHFMHLFLCLFLTITACSVVAPREDTTYPPSEYPINDYPGSEQSYPYPYPFPAYVSPTSPYPQPQATEPEYFATLGPVPTPGTDWGVVTGKLFLDKKPLSNVKLYLADLSKDDKGTDTVASFSPSSSPWAFIDENGNFVFSNVPPGRYSLVYDLVVDSILLSEPGEDKSLILTVEPKKVTDLGDLFYTDLPIMP